MVGRLKFAEVLTPSSRPGYLAAFEAFGATGRIEELECELECADGRRLAVLVSSTAASGSRDTSRGSRNTVFDITRRKQAEEQIRSMVAARERMLAQLEASNKELEAFSYSVSHDLRAPLRHISGYVELLRSRYDAVLDEKGRHYTETIRQSAVHMGELFDDLLVFSRMGRQELLGTRVAMDALLRDAAAATREAEPGAGAAVWDIGPLPDATGDPSMLRLVWTNLLSNAVKYSRPVPAPRIEIRGEARGGEVVYCVRDNGVGFDMQHAGKLFGVFQRLHRADEFEGTGIGLATVQRIIHRHGGTVRAEASPGGGACFTFTLPVPA